MPRENLICLEPGCRFAEAKRPFSESRFLINHYRSAHKGGIEAGRRAVAKQRKAALDADALADAPKGGLVKAGVEVLNPAALGIGAVLEVLPLPTSVAAYLSERLVSLEADIIQVSERLRAAESDLRSLTEERNRCKAALDAYEVQP